MKSWLKNNYLSLLVGLVLPIILSGLWSLFRHPLEMLSSDTLSSLLLASIILCCLSLSFLIFYVSKSNKIILYVEKRFYPSKTIHGTFLNLNEEMEHDKVFLAGWKDATDSH